METEHLPVCASCGTSYRPGDPFCVECGRLSPSMLNTGSYAIEAQDIPGQTARSQVVELLRAWFPGIDPLHAEERFKADWQVLMRGVDENSARRVQAALEAVNVKSRLARDKALPPWQQRLLNPGLAVTAACLLLSFLLGTTAAVFLVPLGITAPLGWAFFASRRKPALISVDEPSFRYDKWSRLAGEYAETIKELGSPDREILTCLSRTVFDLQLKLTSNSLAAVAAGEDRGDLHARLTDAIHTALSLGRRISDLEDEDDRKIGLRQDLVSLTKRASETLEWFKNLERRPPKEPLLLNDELQEVAQRIDRILGQVPSRSESPVQSRKPIGA